ncbi:MAG: transcriptional regulator [Desulfurococcaceae archaeon]
MYKTKSFCEVYTKKILPVAKAYLAYTLVKNYGFSQLKAAKALNMKQSAVNYVVTGRRRIKYFYILDCSPELKNIFDDFAKQLYGGIEFHPCNLCDKLARDRSLLARLVDYINEKEVEFKGFYRAGPLR